MSCPYIFSGDEGTSHCQLAGVTAKQWAEMKAELATLKAQQGAVIEAIMAEVKDETDSDMEYGWNSGLLKAADIVRQHLPIAPAQGGDE